ncbi:Importin subunit beta-1 [Linum perenne]
MPVLFRYLEMRLQNFEDYNVYHATVYAISVICRALEEKVKPYCDAIMTQLLTALVSNQLHRSLWPVIFSCFGNIAMSVGSYFDKYQMHAVPLLESTSAELSTHREDAHEMMNYITSSRNAIMDAYAGMVHRFNRI